MSRYEASAWVAATILLITPVGCVIMPLSRTYYEPNPADGTPIRSSACTWNATALDGLEREIDGITLSLFPKHDAARLRIYVLLGRTSKTADLEPDRVEVRFGDGAAVVRPETTTVKAAGPYFLKSIDYFFPLSSDASEIAVAFLPGFIKLDGKDIDIMQFRFKRVTRWDAFTPSINC